MIERRCVGLDGPYKLVAMFRAAREEKGYTQDEVGGAVGMTGNAYGKIELGRRGLDLSLVGPLCDFLGISRLDAMKALCGESGRPVRVSFPGAGIEPVWGLPDNGYSIMFEPDEWELHKEIARFAGVDERSDIAMRLSADAIAWRRRNKAFGNIRSDNLNGGNDLC